MPFPTIVIISISSGKKNQRNPFPNKAAGILNLLSISLNFFSPSNVQNALC